MKVLPKQDIIKYIFLYICVFIHLFMHVFMFPCMQMSIWVRVWSSRYMCCFSEVDFNQLRLLGPSEKIWGTSGTMTTRRLSERRQGDEGLGPEVDFQEIKVPEIHTRRALTPPPFVSRPLFLFLKKRSFLSLFISISICIPFLCHSLSHCVCECVCVCVCWCLCRLSYSVSDTDRATAAYDNRITRQPCLIWARGKYRLCVCVCVCVCVCLFRWLRFL